MRVSICIGSACHLKGSREVIQKLQKLVAENGLEDKVDLNGDSAAGTARWASASPWTGFCTPFRRRQPRSFSKRRLWAV